MRGGLGPIRGANMAGSSPGLSAWFPRGMGLGPLTACAALGHALGQHAGSLFLQCADVGHAQLCPLILPAPGLAVGPQHHPTQTCRCSSIRITPPLPPARTPLQPHAQTSSLGNGSPGHTTHPEPLSRAGQVPSRRWEWKLGHLSSSRTSLPAHFLFYPSGQASSER